MKIISQPLTWSVELTCSVCGTYFRCNQDDVKVGKFKHDPNTFWFDGSARAVDRFYVNCPERTCGEAIMVDEYRGTNSNLDSQCWESPVPMIIRKRLLDKANE